MTQSAPVTLERVAIRYGLYTAAGFIGFLLCSVHFHAVRVLALEVPNYLILLAGLLGAMRYYQRHTSHPLLYLKGIALGTLTTLVSLVPYTLFLTGYLSWIDPALLPASFHYPASEEPNAFEMALANFIEGMALGWLLSYILIQLVRIGHADQSFNE